MGMIGREVCDVVMGRESGDGRVELAVTTATAG